MKNKKITAAVCALLSACFLSACATTNSQVTFNNFWFNDPTIIDPAIGVLETLTYDVKFTALSKGDGYDLQYNDGTYTATLSMEKVNGENVYVYETELEISGKYFCGADEKAFTDTTSATVKFMKNGKLTPVYSQKTIENYSPTSAGTSIETCYTYVHYQIETEYHDQATSGTTTVTNLETQKTSTKTFEIDSKYTYLDNEQLLFALRGLSQNQSPYFYVYAPFSEKVQTIKTIFNTKEETVEYAYDNGTENGFEGIVNAYPITLQVDAKLSGASQTVWVAEYNPTLNTHRNVILKMQTSLAYNLGTLTYTLKKAEFYNN